MSSQETNTLAEEQQEFAREGNYFKALIRLSSQLLHSQEVPAH